MNITAPVAIGNRDGAQVVSCTVAPDGGGSKPFQAVLKIYDALYLGTITFLKPWSLSLVML